MSYAIYHDLHILAKAARVYEAITSPDDLINWWPLRCSGAPSVGKEYNFFFTDEYNWYGEVSHVVPDQSFYIKMTRSDQDWDPTTFGFDLEQLDGSVLLKFSHTDWPERNHHFRRSSYCWAILLQGLKMYVEEGRVVPFEKRG